MSIIAAAEVTGFEREKSLKIESRLMGILFSLSANPKEPLYSSLPSLNTRQFTPIKLPSLVDLLSSSEIALFMLNSLKSNL